MKSNGGEKRQWTQRRWTWNRNTPCRFSIGFITQKMCQIGMKFGNDGQWTKIQFTYRSILVNLKYVGYMV